MNRDADIEVALRITIAPGSLAALVSRIAVLLKETDPAQTERERRTAASRHALFAGQQPPEDVGLLVDSNEVAKLLKVSARTVWTMQNSGNMPKPIRFGRAVRWGYAEIKAWVDEGCPPKDEWVWPKGWSNASVKDVLDREG